MKTSAQTFLVFFLSVILFGLTACASSEENTDYETAYASSSNPLAMNADFQNNENPGQEARDFTNETIQASGDEQTITIFDKGLQMPAGTYTIPGDWKLVHDVAFDPNTAKAIRYQVDLHGPNGELSRGMQHFYSYGQMLGSNFDQVMQQAVPTAMANLIQQPQFGQLTRSAKFDQLSQFNKMKQRLAAQGMRAEGLELPFAGMKNGQRVKGKLLFIHCSAEWGGLLMAVGQYIAPENNFAQAEATFDRIGQNYRPNPAHEQRLEQINQVVIQQQQRISQQNMAASQAAHQQRMNQNQAAFNAHQQNMQSMSQIQDANHQQYMNNLRNSGSYSTYGNTGNDYNGHDAFIDQIHERSTFTDPYSGQEIHMDGQYKYNYTNGLGEYYRTNDPNFNYNSLQGDWKPINPKN